MSNTDVYKWVQRGEYLYFEGDRCHVLFVIRGVPITMVGIRLGGTYSVFSFPLDLRKGLAKAVSEGPLATLSLCKLNILMGLPYVLVPLPEKFPDIVNILAIPVGCGKNNPAIFLARGTIIYDQTEPEVCPPKKTH